MKKDYSGFRSGHLVAVEPIGKAKNGQRIWLCRCDCGETSRVLQGNLVRNLPKSCGCLTSEIISLMRAASASDPKELFWRHVQKSDDCWLWTGSLDSRGYGRMRPKKKYAAAHRFSYELHHGPIPTGLVVMHGCDNPRCVNPDHLQAGTQWENIADGFRKGRMRPKGRNVGSIIIERKAA